MRELHLVHGLINGVFHLMWPLEDFEEPLLTVGTIMERKKEEEIKTNNVYIEWQCLFTCYKHM